MLTKNKTNNYSLLFLLTVNLIYFVFVIADIYEGVFILWIGVLFVSITPLLVRDKRNIIFFIVLLIPFEITKMLIPIFQVVELNSGAYNSVFDIARLFMMYSFIIWFLTDLKSFIPIVRHRITYIIMIYVVYYFLSSIVISPDTAKGLTETVRYLIYFLFFTMSIQFINNTDDIEIIFKIMIIVAVILSLEGIAEYLFDYRLWVDKGRRAGATYLDPNIFARFLDMVIATLLILRLKKYHIMKPVYMDISLMICLIALFLTISRQGWFILFATIAFFSLFMEKRIRIRIFTVLGIGVAMAIPLFIMLLEARESGLGLYDIGTRAGLLLGGILMFLGSPILGVGAGGFQDVMIARYLDFLPWGINSATLSHTYIVTIMAELGMVGFAIFVYFLFQVYKHFKKIYSVGSDKIKTIMLIIISGIVVIFIGAQAEGRFFEEPYLWLYIALLISMENIVQKTSKLY